MEQNRRAANKNDISSDKEDIISPSDSSPSYRVSSESGNDKTDEDDDEKYVDFSPPRGRKLVSKSHRGIYGKDGINENAAHGAKHPGDSGKNVTAHLQSSKSRSKSVSCRQKRASSKAVEETPNTIKFTAERVRPTYNDHYRQLLNISINDVTGTTDSEGFLPLYKGRIGATAWSSTEKEIFFAALSRLGKDAIRGIALRIGSKSEVEVQEYIKLLHQRMMEKSVDRHWHQLRLTDFPAAVQISQECCDVLETAADGLAIRHSRYEDQVEESKWGSYWLLTRDVNRQVEQKLRERGGGDDMKEILPATELLNLRNWLDLSAKIFMNPAAPREAENWRTLADPDTDEMPAIRATAFEDFYRLAISLTRRLVSATIFCTMSRLRATQPNHFKRTEIVRRADVEAAINSIGLDTNSQKFWIGCPRRCNLTVCRHKSFTTEQTLTSYDELEILLAQGNDPSDQATQSTGMDKVNDLDLDASSSSGNTAQSTYVGMEDSDSAQSEGTVRDLAAEYTTTLEQEFDGPINPSESEFEHPNKYQERVLKKMRLKEEFECAQHRYAEAFDAQASLLEEKRLWELLNQDAPFTIKAENIELPENLVKFREGADKIINWRDGLEFWSPWEIASKPVPAAEFSRSLNLKRKRRASETQVEYSQSSSESSANMAAESLCGESQVSVSEMDVDEVRNAIEGDEGSETMYVRNGQSNSEVGQRTPLRSPSPEKADAHPHGSRSSSISEFDPSILPGFTDVMRTRLRELARGDQVHPPCDECRNMTVTCLKSLKGMCTVCQNTSQKRCSWVNATEEEVFGK